MPDALRLLKTRGYMKSTKLTGTAPSDAEIDTLLTIPVTLPSAAFCCAMLLMAPLPQLSTRRRPRLP
jgi:hypothetical protein